MFLIIAQFSDSKNKNQTYFKEINIKTLDGVNKRIELLKNIGKNFCKGCTICEEPCGDKLISYRLFKLIEEEKIEGEKC
jgi:Pyruvate/2-oxoacid:ferredoxin oxidoreductase delta subunit